MKKPIMCLLFSLMIILFVSGCNSNNSNVDTDLFHYKNSFVGDNSAVGNIVNQLPGAEHLNGFELNTKEEPYGIILHYDAIHSEQQYKEIVINNATFLFALVQNVDWITFNFEEQLDTITKEMAQDWYNKDFSEIETENELINLIQEFVEDENKVRQVIK